MIFGENARSNYVPVTLAGDRIMFLLLWQPGDEFEVLNNSDILEFDLYKMDNSSRTLTHCSRETRKREIGLQCRPRSGAAERGV